MTKNKTIRVLCLFDYNAKTGYGTVSHNLVAEWKKRFSYTYKCELQLDIVAINYFGEPYTDKDGTCVISGKLTDAKKDIFGRHVFLGSLANGDYDVIFILQDLGAIVPIIPHLKDIRAKKAKENKRNFKSIFYFPVDGKLLPKHVEGLEFFDRLATYTEFGKMEVIGLNEKIRSKVTVIPHGTNTKDFYNREDAATYRKEYFGEDNATKFIVANINRNQPRKDIPTAILGFAQYHNRNPHSLLYLHMNPIDPLGYNLYDLMEQLQLVEGKDYMFPPQEYWEKGMSVEDLNLIYNSCDVFFSTATGGGWELTVTEAMAAGLPCIIPYHTSFAEISENGKNAYLLSDLHPYVNQIDNIIRYMCHVDEVDEALSTAFFEQGTAKQAEMKMSAYAFVAARSWPWVANKFAEYFIELA